MQTSLDGIQLITRYEGFRAKPYLCSGGKATIGYGSTFWEDGTPVKMTDKVITRGRGNDLFRNTLKKYESAVNKYVKSAINQNQFDALVSFCYNVGGANLSKSTLLKKVNINPIDLTIKNEFLKWNRAGGIVLQGLINRRKAEYTLYSS